MYRSWKLAVPVTHTVQPLPSSFDGLQVPEQVLQKRVAKVGTAVRLQALIKWSGLPSSLATWEDMETLRQRFPRAPTRGQAGSYRGGNVSGHVSATAEQGVDDAGQADHGPRRGERDHRPNTRIHGPQWA